MKIQLWTKGMRYKCDAIGNILRNTLGTHARHDVNTLGTSTLKNSKTITPSPKGKENLGLSPSTWKGKNVVGSSPDGHNKGTISHGVGTMSHVPFGIWFVWMPHSDPLWVLLFWLGLGFSLSLFHRSPFVGCFVGLAFQGKDIVFRFIIEYIVAYGILASR